MRCAVNFSNNAATAVSSPPPEAPLSWLRHLLPRDEAARLVPGSGPAAHPMLAYVQIIGYARLNHQIGADGAGDPTQSAYWRDPEYSATYVAPECDDKVADILHTPFFEALAAAKSRAAGLHDIHAAGIDSHNYALLRDLVHPYTACQPPPDREHVSDIHRAEIAASVSRFVVPFYVSAQHLLFSSVELKPGLRADYFLECDIPRDIFPPSYNTRLTGSLGDGGLASLAYTFVVGFLEEVNGHMKLRAVYFPLEVRSQNVSPHANWYQHNYLQGVHIDTAWQPRVLLGLAAPEDVPAGAEENGDLAYATFLADLNILINDTPANVAVRERRKSSASHHDSAHQVAQVAQVPASPRRSYQIRVNNTDLCLLTLSSSFYHVGSDIQFFLKSGAAAPSETAHKPPSRVVGYTTHLEAHEVFHLENDRKVVNIYKVSPTVKANTYAEAILQELHQTLAFCNRVHVPEHVTQQFQAPSFMDLRYFLVFRFVLRDFEDVPPLDNATAQSWAEVVQALRLEADGTDFKFSIPVTILP